MLMVKDRSRIDKECQKTVLPSYFDSFWPPNAKLSTMK